MQLSSGCKGDSKSKPEPVVTKKIAAKPKVNKAPAAKPGGKAQAGSTDKPAVNPSAQAAVRLPYDPTGKVDPFQPLFKEDPKPKADKKKAPAKPERPRTPLERLDLGQLRLTAIIFSETRPRAMVEEDNGKGYVVEIGTHIGLERGKITEIKRDRVLIESLKTDDFGNATTRRRELKLQKPAGD